MQMSYILTFSMSIVQILKWPFHAARCRGVSPTQETAETRGLGAGEEAWVRMA